MTVKPITWIGDETGLLRLLDQTRLPAETEWIDCRTATDVWRAIRTLQVRGAPAIGVSAAYGVVLGLQTVAEGDRAAFNRRLDEVCRELASSRPTAVNLFWALDRVRRVADVDCDASSGECLRRVWEEAKEIEAEDRRMCDAIGRHGAPLLAGLNGVLTHCNAGALATAGSGTALAVIVEAVRQGAPLCVYADETRPLWQGARLTAWELTQQNISCTVICDSMAGWVMRQGRVQAVVVGADRIAANGDTANKIGTYSVAQLAQAHGIPFYVAAPTSTFDLSLADGESIPIEERSREEVAAPQGKLLAPAAADVYNPAFDVTPASLIRGIITERGVISPVTADQVRQVVGAPREAASGHAGERSR
ncbi:MAG: S-methyl-5-thioribose-1-phosphate isomerase [Planctomyces sp.]|nr:S-methyl-5-thioribose-1-phosphate isomerase [Planctomyces sp.]